MFGAIAQVALERSKGNVAAAARLLGLKRHQLEIGSELRNVQRSD